MKPSNFDGDSDPVDGVSRDPKLTFGVENDPVVRGSVVVVAEEVIRSGLVRKLTVGSVWTPERGLVVAVARVLMSPDV